MSTLLIRNARYIVSCDDQDTLWEHANLFIRDNAIEYIGPELMHADQTIDASDMVVYPGLVNPLRGVEKPGRGGGLPLLPHRYGRDAENRLHHLL